MGSASGGGDCARAANQGSVEQHLSRVLIGNCSCSSNRENCSGEVVHSARIRTWRLAQLRRCRRIDARGFAPKLRDSSESRDARPCRQRRHDRCCFEIAPSNFKAWQATWTRRDQAIARSLRPMSSLLPRPSVAKRSRRRSCRALPRAAESSVHQAADPMACAAALLHAGRSDESQRPACSWRMLTVLAQPPLRR
jgi:hypothetical protein